MTALAIARFELARRARLLSTYVYFVVFFAAAALFTIAAGGGFPGANVSFGSSKVLINAPYALNQTITVLGYLGVLVTAALMGRAVQQDYEHETFHFFFTSPVSASRYLAGRFLGALLALTGIFSSIALGCFLGVHFPTVEPSLVGPDRLAAYLHPYLVSVIPNLLGTGAIFFAMGALGRRMMPVYVAAVVMLIGYLIAGSLMGDLEDRWLAALLDPWGNRAMHLTTEYWPVADRNTRLVPLEGYFLWNRVLWLGLGAAVLAFTFARFRFAQPADSGRATRPVGVEGQEPGPGGALPRIEPQLTRWTYLRMLPRLSWLTFKETVKNVYFLVIALAGMLFMFVSARALGTMFGTNTYPVTYQVLELTAGSFALFMIIIATFYSGELVWRERDARVDQIHDALPIPTWLPLAMKLGALIGTQVLLALLILASTLTIQVAKGYYRFELGLQLHFLFTVFLPDFVLICVLAIAIQTLVNQKYVGHFLVVLYWLAALFAPQLGFEDYLYQYGQSPEVTYSDMNGYGHFLGPRRWFNLYWGMAALLAASACHLFWVRGVDSTWRSRLAGGRQRFTPPVRLWTGAAAAGCVAAGAVIFYNSRVLNTPFTQDDALAAAARYEKRHRARLEDPQPKVKGVKVAADLFPGERRASLRGSYQLKNETGQPISAVLLDTHREVTIRELALDRPHRLERNDEDHFHAAVLEAPLQPGEEAELRFDLEYAARGFRQRDQLNRLAANGTFFDSMLLPHLGYQKRRELVEDKDRRKHGLEPRERMLDRDDPEGLQRNCLNGEADFVTFEATVSTSKDQVALAPGYLQREWEEGGRRHFEYKMDAPILNYFAFLSARYAVQRDLWNDVAIEVYYQPGHEFNVERMIAAVKASLEYFTRAFGPYQHRQVRILEFPRYARFAQSFPNTIPFSESIGFIARVDESDPEDVDYPYFVTAHEIAHQWWAHQVIGGDVQGCSMLSETLSEYSALMVMKQKYGAERMRKFLQYELHRYLMGRAFEQKKEVPLSRVENQTYIHYNKGGVVMYALADLLGEETVNRALAAFLDRTRMKGPPYPNSTQLIEELRKVTPADLQYVIDDWFERIVLYENRAISAEYKKRTDGKYEVKLKVFAKKIQADELGAEKEAPLQDVIQVGVLDEEDRPITLEWRRFDRSGETELKLVVDRAPARAGIDPMNKLVDRKVDDNTVRAEAL